MTHGSNRPAIRASGLALDIIPKKDRDEIASVRKTIIHP